ncbi:TlpA disulfide reductase family protein [Granulicella sp. S156]|uniref:TlpA family protein disulfide reductase n=1 Tax=Granulicella sp. S156 TaxID=1747224 RepID=UPI00131C5128|nr:TlpA disulfide reductase family protein [Granulicella sp. S156]
MHRSLSLLPPLLVLLSGLSPVLKAQSSSRLPGCEVNPDVQNVIDQKLDSKLLDGMTFVDRLALQRKTLEALIAQYPRELEPYTRLRDLLRQFSPDEYPKLRDSWIQVGKDHPNDPLMLLLAGEALNGVDTPESIRLLQSARAQAPQFPWAARHLAGIYSDGKLADPAKAKENIDAFFAICPTSSDGYALYLLSKADALLQPKVAAARVVASRTRLEKETAPKELKGYSALWTLEFQTRKPQEYEAERQQITQDLARMEKIHPKGDAEWQALLIKGYKQSGAPKEKIVALEDKLIAEHPHSNQAYDIVSDRWDKAHPDPQDQTDVAAWNKHRKDYEAALQGWIRDYPDDTYMQRNAWFFAVRDDDTISKEDTIAALDAYLRAIDIYSGPYWQWAFYPLAAQLLVERGLEPDRAIDLLKQAKSTYETNWAREGKSDNLSDEEVKRSLDWKRQHRQDLNGLMLKAAIQANKPEIAAELRTAVEAPPPDDKKLLEGYWTNHARVALLTGNRIDALAYYQMALQTRQETPKLSEGKLRDDLGDEAHVLWKQQGGTETAWDTWSRLPAADKTILAEGRWEKPKKSIPAFELTDLSGKTWRLKELNGKSVLIDVWATWCGPCQAELPNLQKLYEQVKGRDDIQILTFDYDSNPGVVGPYLKDKGYTFPVLPIVSAAQIEDAVNDNGIPQNWVLDRSGTSLWRQIGYGPESYDDFSKDMLTRLSPVPANK